MSNNNNGAPEKTLSKQIPPGPIEPGDAGLVFKQDGMFYLFNTYSKEDLVSPTPEQERTMLILDAFSVAIQHPKIIEVLITMANDPEVRGPDQAPDLSKPKH